MNRNKWLFLVVIAAAVLLTVGGVALFRPFTGNAPDETAQSAITSSFGITYVPVRGKQAESLGVSSGALVTEVAAGSPADRAGLQVNDVILTFNGTTVENGAPLYGMMTSCPMGGAVNMEVWHQQMIKQMTLMKANW